MIPLHPILVHFPLALSFLMPILAFITLWMILKKTFTKKTWGLVVGLQLVLTVTGYVSMETGEDEEDTIAKVVPKSEIHKHEERAEIFVASSVASLVFSAITFIIKDSLYLPLGLITTLLMLAQGFLGYRTGQSGGDLVYGWDAPRAYTVQEQVKVEAEPQGILPTPGMNTSESENPIDEAEEDELSEEEPDKEED